MQDADAESAEKWITLACLMCYHAIHLAAAGV